MTGRPLPRDRRITRCPAGCGAWCYFGSRVCAWCGAQLDWGSAVSVWSSPPRRSGFEPPTPTTRRKGRRD